MDMVLIDFLNSPFYKNLFLNKDIIGIYVGGSRLTNVIDEKSDYDLVILTNGGKYENVNKHAFIKWCDSIKLHWYYIPIIEL